MADKKDSITLRVSKAIPSDVAHGRARISGGNALGLKPGDIVEIKGEEQRRSYSICSSGDEHLAIGVKIVDKGIVSNWFNQEAKEGTKIHIAVPQGSFKIPKKAKNVAAIAAGSGSGSVSYTHLTLPTTPYV